MYAIYGNIYHQYTPYVSIYTIHGSYRIWLVYGYFTSGNGMTWIELVTLEHRCMHLFSALFSFEHWI